MDPFCVEGNILGPQELVHSIYNIIRSGDWPAESILEAMEIV